MSYYDHKTSDENSYAELPDGSTTWTQFRSYEWWETFDPDGQAYSTGATREDAIEQHTKSNRQLTEAAAEINELRRKNGDPADYTIELTPVHGVRHVIRWESDSGFQRVDKDEIL